MAASDVLSVQIADDPGWRARVENRMVSLRADQLGFIVVDPRCIGECSVDLEFTGGPERRITLAIGLLVWMALLVMAL